MALIVDNYIIKTPLLEILENIKVILNNTKLKDIRDKGNELVITCPNDNHSGGCEQDPDCHVNLKEDDDVLPYGTFNCFACGAHGSFVKLVALCFSCAEVDAKQWLISNYGELLKDTIQLPTFTLKRKNIINKIDTKVLDQYQSWTPYLQQRNLSRNVCEYFKVKYDPVHRQVIFPCFDIKNNLVMLPKRNIDNKVFYLDKDTTKPLYCINYVANNNLRSICMVEGPIDCLTCYSNNIPAVATLGKPSVEQFEMLDKTNVNHIYLMFDNDDAGKKFTEFAKAHLSKRIIIDTVQLPMGKKDINDLNHQEILELIKKNNLPVLTKL